MSNKLKKLLAAMTAIQLAEYNQLVETSSGLTDTQKVEVAEQVIAKYPSPPAGSETPDPEPTTAGHIVSEDSLRDWRARIQAVFDAHKKSHGSMTPPKYIKDLEVIATEIDSILAQL